MKAAEIYRKYNIGKANLDYMIEQGLEYELSDSNQKIFDEVKVDAFVKALKKSIMDQLIIGKEYTNIQISEIFRANLQKGMKKSNTANALVLLSMHTDDNMYEDKWYDDIFYYTGTGVQGDQTVERTENKILYESRTNGVTVHLFEQFPGHEYTYVGIVQLCEEPFQKDELDEDGKMRKVWKFPLALVDSNTCIENKLVEETVELQEKKAVKMTDQDLIDKAKQQASEHVSSRTTVSKTYQRNGYVKEYSLRRADGICELCGNNGPFILKDRYYLESHHIEWLSRGGKDEIDNVAAVCPNCHKRLHALDSKSDLELLIRNVEEDERKYINRLNAYEKLLKVDKQK